MHVCNRTTEYERSDIPTIWLVSGSSAEPFACRAAARCPTHDAKFFASSGADAITRLFLLFRRAHLPPPDVALETRGLDRWMIAAYDLSASHSGFIEILGHYFLTDRVEGPDRS